MNDVTSAMFKEELKRACKIGLRVSYKENGEGYDVSDGYLFVGFPRTVRDLHYLITGYERALINLSVRPEIRRD